MKTIDELNQQFTIPEIARFEVGRGNLPRLVITAPTAEGHIYLHGAHVTHYQRPGQGPIFFLSTKSFFEQGKAIRGGVPVIFPWFGPRAGDATNMHGFVRTRPWEVAEVKKTAAGVKTVMTFASSGETRAIWDHDFELRLAVTFGPSLEMELQVRNPSPQPIKFEEALHTYLAVGDVRTVTIEGLGGTDYVDKVAGLDRATQDDPILKLTGLTDRVYMDTKATCIVDDKVNGRKISVAKKESNSTVVWNPWADKITSMADLDADIWPNFLCVETCNVRGGAIELPPGHTHTMSATISA
jgi:glucose-6-phosphate 1-epimerase